MSLDFCVNATEATWLTASPMDRSEDGSSRLVLLGPSGFEAYARVLSLPDPRYAHQPEAEVDDATLNAIPADAELISGAVELLTNATATPDNLYFLLWEGWPGPELPTLSRFEIAGMRRYTMARGTLADWLNWSESDHGNEYAPGFVWPADRAWCIAQDVDAHFAGVAGTTAAITHLLNSSIITAVAASIDDSFMLYG